MFLSYSELLIPRQGKEVEDVAEGKHLNFSRDEARIRQLILSKLLSQSRG